MSRATPTSGSRTASAISDPPECAGARGPAPDERDLRLKDLRVRVYGDVAVAMGEARAVDGTGDGDDARYHVTRVYAWRHGRWQRVAGDTTRLAPPDAR